MANTIYAAFNDASLAEKAAGALLDHGVRNEDLSLVRNHNGEVTSMDATTVRSTSDTTIGDRDNDIKNTGDAAWGETRSVGDRAAEYGDRAAGGVADALGAEGTASRFRAAANERDMEADERAMEAKGQLNDAVDRDNVGMTDINRPSDYTSTQMNIDNPGGYSGGQALNDISAADADATANPNVGYGTTYERTEVVNDPDYQANVRDDDDDDHDAEGSAKHGISTTTGADAGSGAMKGAGIGLGLGILAGIASLFVPGVGLVVGGGALAAALGGAAATTAAGAVAGGVTGYLKDQGVDAHIAEDYDNVVKNGGALLAVTVPSGNVDEARVREILGKYGAANVNAYAAKGYMA